MQAQRKPVVVEFIPYEGDNIEVHMWVESIGDVFAEWFQIGENGGLYVRTLEGTSYEITTSDMIVRGINHEFYPCKKDIFHKSYDII